jgi:hypothetical protein
LPAWESFLDALVVEGDDELPAQLHLRLRQRDAKIRPIAVA